MHILLHSVCGWDALITDKILKMETMNINSEHFKDSEIKSVFFIA